MAKRRKEKDEEEDKPFKLPKFDEEAFLKRERRNVKSTFISFNSDSRKIKVFPINLFKYRE